MSVDVELEGWAEGWRRTGEVPRDLSRTVRRERLQWALGLWGGWAALLGFVAACAVIAVGDPRLVTRAIAVFSALFALLALALHTRQHLAVGRAESECPAAYLHERRRRLVGELTLARTWWPYALLIGALALWIPWKLESEWETLFAPNPGLTLALVLGVVGLTAGAAAAQWLGARRLVPRIAALDDLLQEVEGDPEAQDPSA